MRIEPRWLDTEAAADYISVRPDALMRLVRAEPTSKAGVRAVTKFRVHTLRHDSYGMAGGHGTKATVEHAY